MSLCCGLNRRERNDYSMNNIGQFIFWTEPACPHPESDCYIVVASAYMFTMNSANLKLSKISSTQSTAGILGFRGGGGEGVLPNPSIQSMAPLSPPQKPIEGQNISI
jgi:hypothetical protein